MKTYKYTINGNAYNVTVNDIEGNTAHVDVNGTAYTIEMDKQASPSSPMKPIVKPAAPAAQQTATSSQPAASSGKAGVKSPLPGVVLDLKVNVGDSVKKGDVVLVLEAMKMENNINADRDGKVTAVHVKNGDSVLEGTELVTIE